jgi:hypothetical protein
MDDTSDAQPRGEVTTAEDGKHRTWPTGVPPMRLNRRAARYSNGHRPGAPQYDAAPPSYLRPLRALVGLVLLTVAWIALLAVFVVGHMLWRRATSARPLSFHLSLYVLSLAATCWVAVAAVACIVAGAFSLALAITRRGW